MVNATTWVLLAAAVLAVGAVVVLAVLFRRAGRRHAETVESLRASHDTALADTQRDHEDRIARADQQHGRDRAALERSRDDALREAEDSRAFIAESLRWDEPSHDAILDACRRLGLRGVLATNVVFVPTDAGDRDRFVAQVDHVLLTRHAALVLENKRWRGLVFDGVRPSTVHAAFRDLFDESILERPFAIQVRRESTTSWDVRTQVGGESPASQVRRQAQRLNGLVRASGLGSLWFESCVFYSHPDATVYAEREDASPGGAKTAVVAGRHELDALLRRLAERPPTTLTEDRIGALSALLARQGARVVELDGAAAA